MKAVRVLVLLLGAAALAALVIFAGARSVDLALVHVGFAGLAGIALIRVGAVAACGWAWYRIGAQLEGARPWKFIWARYLRETTAEVLPFSQLGGLAAGVRALNVTGMAPLPASAALLADLLLEQGVKIPYVLTGAAVLLVEARGTPVRLVAVAVLPPLMLIFAAVVARGRASGWLERALGPLTRRWPVLEARRPQTLRALLGPLLRRALRSSAPAAHGAAWLLGAVQTWLACRLMGLAVSPAQALIVDSLLCGLRTVGFVVPAALGIQEAGYVLVCALVGIPAAPAVALSLLRRLSDLALGAPALGVWPWIEGRRALARLGQK